MRDIGRISIVVAKLQELWMKHPDLRLGQLIFNLGSRVRQNGPTRAVFQIEDNEMLAEIERQLREKP